MEFAEGGCYCEKVKFKVAMPATWSAHCHCTQCQRLHGAAFVTWVGFKTNEVEIIDPDNLFTRFSTGIAEQGFCRNCGSPFYFKYTKTSDAVTKEWLDYSYFALTNFTKGPKSLPTHNIFFESHPRWVEDVFNLPKPGTSV